LSFAKVIKHYERRKKTEKEFTAPRLPSVFLSQLNKTEFVASRKDTKYEGFCISKNVL
jgi:hypothetical protein